MFCSLTEFSQERKTLMRLNPVLPQKGGQFGITGWILCYLIENQLPEVGNHSLMSLWSCCSPELAVCCSPLTMRREQHHCRHMAPRSQKTVWRLYSLLFAIHHHTPSPPAISLCVLTGASCITGIDEYKLYTFVPEIYAHVSTCTQSVGMQGRACAHANIAQLTRHAPYIKERYFFWWDPATSWTCHWEHSQLRHDLPLKHLIIESATSKQRQVDGLWGVITGWEGK